jgi:hypothetical protein
VADDAGIEVMVVGRLPDVASPERIQLSKRWRQPAAAVFCLRLSTVRSTVGGRTLESIGAHQRRDNYTRV